MGLGQKLQGTGLKSLGLKLWLCLVPCALCLSACNPVTRPVIKIGLVAPFEGRYRDVGYEVVYAVRLAVREANAGGGVAGHTVELTALDDGGDPALAVDQALKLATDPQVVGVIGHWLDETTVAAAPAYVDAGLPLLATTAGPLPAETLRLWLDDAADDELGADVQRCPTPCGWLEGAAWLETVRAAEPDAGVAGPPQWVYSQFATLAGGLAEGAYVVLPAPLPANSADPGFGERYRAISNGVEPGAYAVLAYDAANTLFAAIELGGADTREGVGAALDTLEYEGLSGQIQFGEAGMWQAWVYVWRGGALEVVP
jgi:ABC-type branched-subunit amino acid transport system substrate-binding protein